MKEKVQLGNKYINIFMESYVNIISQMFDFCVYNAWLDWENIPWLDWENIPMDLFNYIIKVLIASPDDIL